MRRCILRVWFSISYVINKCLVNIRRFYGIIFFVGSCLQEGICVLVCCVFVRVSFVLIVFLFVIFFYELVFDLRIFWIVYFLFVYMFFVNVEEFLGEVFVIIVILQLTFGVRGRDLIVNIFVIWFRFLGFLRSISQESF